MDRCALFVDASYVLADGGMAVHGTRRRESVSWDYAGLLQLLGNLAMERTRLPLLRCYWYEATVEGRRSADHDALADLPGVKLRVAKMRPGRREGVESEIHRDLTTLARNKAVSDAMVVSAEEDLAQVIADVQDMGMRVTLLQITGDGSMPVSRALQQECDDIVEITAAHLRPYVELISGAEPPRPDESDTLLTLRPVMNGSVNGTVNGNVNGRSGAGHSAAYAQQQGRTAPAAGEYRQVSEGLLAIDQAGGQVPHPVQADAAQPDSGQLERGTEYAPVADYGAGVDYGAPADYAPADYGPAFDQGAAADYAANMPGVDYGPTVDYAPVPDYVPSPVPSAAREDLYAAPVVVPIPDDLPGDRDRDRLSARSRQQADLSAYNPGAVREQYQRDGLPRETGAGDPGDRFQPAPIAIPGGSAQVRRLPARGPGSGGPNQGQPPLGLPAAPPVPPPAPTVTQPAVADGPIGQVPGGPVQVGPPTGGQPVAPVLSMDGNGLAYPGARGGSYGGPRQVMPGPGAPLPPMTGPGGAGSGQQGPGAHPSLTPVPSGHSGPQNPPPGSGGPGNPGLPGGQGNQGGQGGQGGQQDITGQSGPLGLVGPGTYPGGPGGVSLADAVQSAHEEGQAFGESVARDAPALWLEAVLARKPRMPSDLEARLLQGSALPIDFLLHDEVRHALRRGFWDALERTRR